MRTDPTDLKKCNWPGCSEMVPTNLWGCKKHWFTLPEHLRKKVWKTYRPGQEKDLNPSQEYVETIMGIRRWIASRQANGPMVVRHERT